MRPVLALAALLLLISGCFSVGPAPAGHGAPAMLGRASGLPTGPVPEAPTLAVPPLWRLGEWWTYRFSDFITRQDHEITLIVAGANASAYELGTVKPGDELAILSILHYPGYGEIDRSTLGWRQHDEQFQPLSFPLVEGGTWATYQWFETLPLRATAHVANVTVARIDFADPNGSLVLSVKYDAAARAISLVDFPHFMRVDLIAHGFDYHGPVHVPEDAQLVFCHGRYRQTETTGAGCAPGSDAAGVFKVAVPAKFTHASAAIFFYAGAAADGNGRSLSPGAFDTVVTAPDGTAFHLQKLPTDPYDALLPVTHTPVAGEWTIDAKSLGDGDALFEGVVYTGKDIVLPDA